MKTKINIYDMLLIIFIIVISSFFILYNSRNITYSNTNIAVIYSEDKIVGEYILKESYKNEIAVKSSNGYNNIKIENGKIWIEGASCPDQYCIHQGKISGNGENIVCLPNKLIIKVMSDKKNKEIDFIAP
ncbi:hypothetical protein J2Z76_000805 [Sedimentibacter acidaminivorans]|uniref:NusG domain-containing protein n=1 Tax=Sedimentibacter acidaminivorans TaxID=913099 RepID=A0ABS4GB86_9FIRM|nr:NusG domain II-containing protein [Sedimentibacter acidaminivorans]MBP1924948.1 hypothetical protein [Sedimentibacter acidaminivorans]